MIFKKTNSTLSKTASTFSNTEQKLVKKCCPEFPCIEEEKYVETLNDNIEGIPDYFGKLYDLQMSIMKDRSLSKPALDSKFKSETPKTDSQTAEFKINKFFDLHESESDDDVDFYANTSIRKDVMNKTLFRSVRREYKELFTQFCESKGYKIMRSTKNMQKAIKEFAMDLVNDKDMNELTMKYGDMCNLLYYVGLFVNFCKMRKIMKDYPDKSVIQSFYDCLYGYSHRKFYDFVKRPEVSFLMKKILDDNHIDALIDKYSTLSKNKKHYKVCAKSIVLHIDG